MEKDKKKEELAILLIKFEILKTILEIVEVLLKK